MALFSYDFLRSQVVSRLGGDERRIAELFKDRAVFEALQAGGTDGDWYHFRQKAFDGWYLVEGADGFEVYFQERGRVSSWASFPTLNTAAIYFFSESGYARP
ncbi:hypothetical protein GCM10007320_30060 [Pseudorhodoferax aquiterrae]|uniref:Uncharacterized protein n=1 Tax=Pseudorhodoferax aquiterrae TaxID=747304 RepID=A0ABQ3G488_9BURK|nr:hypothetical protein [Pseudorhodoferax aquiterrae]GHC85250.1 hypothetical protein GCM10007320_30060 [Pseudorhodoferax aquiterrae]